ncbi:PQQ-dependent sugar dehydrogenase [Aequorivita capsosiphonis]|uniref:PQQ-dependent sugar dehydrogenase n=1 Tax=Aequorivita capsosiphonis TaxID=487317 RepID=UPI00040D2746|nr:PQQ-dependent sugar dehydrogenase [Aequorivita capsosiphonis]
MKKYISIAMAFVVFASCAQQKKENDIALKMEAQTYKIEEVVKNLSIPWGMVWLPDGSMLITEKDGRLIHFKDGKKVSIANVPKVYNSGQGGLLDIELHPDYKDNGWIYITYASEEGAEKGGHTALMRCKLDGNSLTNLEKLYKAEPNTTAGQHFGSRIEFDDDDFLYFSIGERGERDVNPQDITRDGGKIYRLNDDGSIPEDNPFYNEPNAKKAIYTYGNRNPQGMAKNPETGKIWIHEHGPKGGDEINIVKNGANYGWPTVTYGINYSGTKITDETSSPEIESPVYYWVPSIAPSGMAFVTSDKYPNWKGKLLVGSLKFAYVELLTLEGEKVINREKIAQDIGRVRNVKMGPNGLIYIAVEGQGIFRLIPE